MYLITIFLPFVLINFIFVFSKFFSKNFISKIITFFIFLNFLFSIVIFFEIVLLDNICILELANFWFSIEILKIEWIFIFDSLSVTMILIVNFISFLVHLYSIEYMYYDLHKVRFFLYLSLFTFFMIFLLTSGNFVQMFFGWEGVGLTSFLLINFWFNRVNANKAALKAMLVNRFGDCGLLFAIFLLFNFLKSVDFYTIFLLINNFYFYEIKFLFFKFLLIDFISFFFFLGISAKSVQFGLHIWLPDAMEGPTPVSALLHAATMVTAGLYLIIRCSFIFEYSSFILFIFCFFGGLTAFFAALIACFQFDLKKIIAYSTCSQLGYMILCCGFSFYSLGLFHFFNHSFFKALLFLGVGAIIHSIDDNQDFFNMGNLYVILPFTTQVFLVGIVSLISLPFFSGFYSKDVIIEISNTLFFVKGYFFNLILNYSSIFTIVYNINMYRIVFFEDENFNLKQLLKVCEPGIKILGVCCILVFFSIFSGFIFQDLFLGYGIFNWNNCIFILPENSFNYEFEFFFTFWKIIFLFFILFLFFLFFIGFDFLLFSLNFYEKMNFFLDFFCLNWFYDSFYNYFLKNYFLVFCKNYFLILIDKGLLELLGSFGITKIFLLFFLKIKQLHSGFLFNYYFFVIIFFFLCVFLIETCFFYFNTLISCYFFLLFYLCFCMFLIKK